MKTLWTVCMIVMVLFGMTVIVFPDVPSKLSYYLPQVVGLYKTPDGYKTIDALYNEGKEEEKEQNESKSGVVACYDGNKVTVYGGVDKWTVNSTASIGFRNWTRISDNNFLFDCKDYYGNLFKCVRREKVPCDGSEGKIYETK